MHEFEEFMKDLLFIAWCLYVTVACFIGIVQADEFIDAMAGFFVWGFVIAISAGIKGT